MKKIERAGKLFEETFGAPAGDVLAVHAPARSEIAGNHTDHEGGHVIAGALNVAVEGVAVANGTGLVRVASEGYPLFEVSLEDVAARPEERLTTASLVRGMASCLKGTGREPRGFDLALASDIPVGGGLSSSAAVEVALGRAMEALWPGEPVPDLEIARMAQRAENEHFGKPCGLMDQLAVTLGGLAFMDFEDAGLPRFEKLELDFEQAGYALCLVDVGCDHSAFTADYAAVPEEMQQVALEFGCRRLCEVDADAFDGEVRRLREKLGDRAVLRAVHYWRENELVDLRWRALKAGDMDRFLELTRESGASSAMFLQNVSAGGAYQPAMLALGLAERALEGYGAVRIHGGGFGGSIQVFVPVDMAEGFAARMDAWMGEGSCRRYAVVEDGAGASWL